MVGHRLDAVDAGAQVDAIEIQLEDLVLGQLELDQQRDDRFLGLPGDGPDVRQKQRPRQLLRQGAAAFRPRAAAQVADERPGQANRIDAGVGVEAAIFDGDDRVLQVGRDRVERDVVALFIEPEPRLAVAAVEHGVADAARQPMDGDGMAGHPPDRDGARHDGRGDGREEHPLPSATRAESHVRPKRPRDCDHFAWSYENVSWSSARSMVTVPPCSSRPNRISSVNGSRTSFCTVRPSGLAPKTES